MALKERWTPIQFSHGLDTETNAKTVIPGKLTDLENGTFQERVTIVKRQGTRLLSRRWAIPTGYSQVSGAIGISGRDDGSDLVMLTTTDELGSYDESTDSWVKRGDWLPVRQRLDSLARGPNEGWDVTACSSGNVQLWAWEDLRGGVYGRIRALDTGRTSGPEFRIGGALGRQPTALAVGAQFHVYFTSGTANTMNVAVINPANPTSVSATLVQLHSSLSGGNPTYCVDTLPGWNSSRIAIAVAGGTFVAVVRENGTIGATGSTPSYPNPVTFDPSQVNPDLCLSPDGTRMAVSVKGDAARSRSVYARIYDPTSFAVLTASVTLDSGSAVIASDTSVDRIGCGYWGPDGSGSFLTAYSSMSASNPSNRLIRFGTVQAQTLPYQSLGSGNLIRHTMLTSRPFRFGDHQYLWGTQVSPAQTTDFLVRHDGNVDAVSRYSLAYPIASGVLSRVEVRSDAMSPVVARRGVTTRDQFVSVSGGLSAFGDRHPELLSLTYHPSASWRPVDVAGNLYMPGGYLGKYDGSSVTENNFLMAVEGLVVTPGSSSVGAGNGVLQSGSLYGPISHNGPLASASFVYQVIPVAYDAMGNEEQGGFIAPTQGIQAVFSASLGQIQNTASLTWNTIAHTRRNGTTAPDIRYKVFRTGFMNGVPLAVPQRIDDPARPIVNSTSSDTMTFTDNVGEATRRLGEVSYTTFTPMNSPTPSVAHIAQQGARLYLAGVEGQPTIVIPSKLRLGGPISFTDGMSYEVDSAGGPITGLGAIDDRVMIFKGTRLFHAPTDGPDNTLTDTTPFRNPELLTSDLGASEPAAIVQVAGTKVQGLIFKSNRGFRAAGREIGLTDIGAPVKRFDSLNVVAGLSPSDAEEARFYTSEGITIVLNTRHNEWSTFPEQEAVSACIWRGAPSYVGSDGRVRVEATGTWLDNSLPYSMRFTTGWLPLQGLQGLSRVRRLLVLGDFHSHHKLRVEMAVDYRDSWVVLKEIDTRTALGVLPYGGDEPSFSGSLGAPGTSPFGVIPASLLVEATGALASAPPIIISAPTVTGSSALSLGAFDPFIFPGMSPGPSGSFSETNPATGGGFSFNFSGSVTTLGGLLSHFPSQYFTVTDPGFAGQFPELPFRVTSSVQFVQISGGLDPVPPVYPSPGYYGSGSYGGRDPVYQFEFRLPVERFQTCRFRFTDVDQAIVGSSENGRSFSLTEMRLLVAADSPRPSLPTRKIRG